MATFNGRVERNNQDKRKGKLRDIAIMDEVLEKHVQVSMRVHQDSSHCDNCNVIKDTSYDYSWPEHYVFFSSSPSLPLSQYVLSLECVGGAWQGLRY